MGGLEVAAPPERQSEETRRRTAAERIVVACKVESFLGERLRPLSVALEL